MNIDDNVTMSVLQKELQDILDNLGLIKDIQKNKTGSEKSLNSLEYYKYIKNLCSNKEKKEYYPKQVSDDLTVKMTQAVIKIEDYVTKNYPDMLTPVEQIFMKSSGRTDEEINNYPKIIN